jgi:uracil-DNA glycosylase
LQNWNTALQLLCPAVQHPDEPTPLALYGDTWLDGDRVAIPQADFPAGLPAWMHQNDGWARRAGADALAKRRNITITVTKGVVT